MPLYSYECKECKKVHEVRHQINGTLENCPSCNSKNIRRLIGKPGFKINGYCHKNEYGGKK